MNTPNTTDLTPALFTPAELSHIRKVVKEADTNLARKYLEAGLTRAADLRASKKKDAGK